MTRARTSKALIRARMQKTGERYTAARRHLLAAERPAPAPLPPTHSAAPPAPVEAKGAVSNARVVDRTGHDLEYWYGVLDRAGAGRGHTALARHLREVHGVGAWYSQGITVSYERARGLRTMHERPGGTFEGSVSKTIAAALPVTLAAFSTSRTRARWTSALDAAESTLLTSAMRGTSSPGFVARARGEYRCRARGSHGLLEVTLVPRAAGSTTVQVLHSGVPARARLDDVRRQWREVLAALAAVVTR